MRIRAMCAVGLALAAGVVRSAAAQAPLLTLTSSGCAARLSSTVPKGASPDSSARTTDSTRGGDSKSPAHPDILLLVGVSADEVVFHSQPNASVRLCWGSDSLHIVERRNLPSPVVPGTTYRNVFIAAELRGFLNAECAARTLGVSPAPDSAAAGSSCAALGLTTAGAPAASVSRPPP